MIDFHLDRPYVIFIAATLTIAVSFAGSRLAMFSGALLDRPSERSSHTVAVSRAGGLAMLAAFLTGLFVVSVFVGEPRLSSPAWKFALFAIVAGAVGLADDHLNLRPFVKFAGQFFASLLFVWLLGPLSSAPFPFYGNVDLGMFGVLITVFWIVAFMNVFNFMDGVNGIAAGASIVGLGIFCALAVFAGAYGSGLIACLGVFAALGFLPANVLRKRLFMGDCGSHFLASVIAGLAVYAANESQATLSPLVLPLIFAPFIIDVGMTLFHRLVRGENVLRAHREHIYQIILQQGASHETVAILYAGAIALCGGFAIVMLVFSPSLQWIVLILPLLGLIIVGGVQLHRANERGLISLSGNAGD